MSRTISASAFKATCLGLLDEVAATGTEIVVTKRGKPIARIVALEQSPSLEGSVTYLVDEDELVEPILEPWDAEHSTREHKP
jgi:prevent-host-death family protein